MSETNAKWDTRFYSTTGLTPSATILRPWGDGSRAGSAVFEGLVATGAVDVGGTLSLRPALNRLSRCHRAGAITVAVVLMAVELNRQLSSPRIWEMPERVNLQLRQRR